MPIGKHYWALRRLQIGKHIDSQSAPKSPATTSLPDVRLVIGGDQILAYTLDYLAGSLKAHGLQGARATAFETSLKTIAQQFAEHMKTAGLASDSTIAGVHRMLEGQHPELAQLLPNAGSGSELPKYAEAAEKLMIFSRVLKSIVAQRVDDFVQRNRAANLLILQAETVCLFEDVMKSARQNRHFRELDQTLQDNVAGSVAQTVSDVMTPLKAKLRQIANKGAAYDR